MEACQGRINYSSIALSGQPAKLLAWRFQWWMNIMKHMWSRRHQSFENAHLIHCTSFIMLLILAGVRVCEKHARTDIAISFCQLVPGCSPRDKRRWKWTGRRGDYNGETTMNCAASVITIAAAATAANNNNINNNATTYLYCEETMYSVLPFVGLGL